MGLFSTSFSIFFIGLFPCFYSILCTLPISSSFRVFNSKEYFTAGSLKAFLVSPVELVVYLSMFNY
jgi:hypothetical protein